MTCLLSGLPITGGTPANLLLLKTSSYAKYVDDTTYGSTHLISNEGPSVLLTPFAFPLKGIYDDYGGLEVEEDDNTKILEEYFGLPIVDIVNIVTSNRKSDGCDDALEIIKKPKTYPKDWEEGEDHFKYYQRVMNDPIPFGNDVYPDDDGGQYRIIKEGKKIPGTKEEYDAQYKLIHEHYARYQEWSKNNPDPEDDRKNPQYEEKYKELLGLSGMWIHRTFYEELTAQRFGDYFDKLDIGTREILEAIGFKYAGEEKGKGRYNQKFTKDGITIYSDGTWLEGNTYDLPELKKKLKSQGVDIDIDDVHNKDRTEQIYDYLIPSFGDEDQENLSILDKLKGLAKEKLDKLMAALARNSRVGNKNEALINHMLLADPYNMPKLSVLYLDAAKKGKLRDDIVRFWRFHYNMYCTGRYYAVVGMSPQDGERRQVLKMLDVAREVLINELKDREDDEVIEEDEDFEN